MAGSDYGRARVTPAEARAGEKGAWTIEHTVGRLGIREGGGLRIVPPVKGMVLWTLGKAVAFCDRPGVSLEVVTDKTYPLSYHHSNYPSVTAVVWGGALEAGDTVRVVIGAPGAHVSGRFVQTRAQRHSGEATWQVFADVYGNGRFQLERRWPEGYQPVPGDLTVTVRPNRAARLRCTLRQPPIAGGDCIGVVAVEDRYENPIVEEAFDIRLRVERGDLTAPGRVHKAAGKASVTFPVQVGVDQPGWLSASCWEEGIYGASNPLWPGLLPDGEHVYFGDLHVMTGSYGNMHMDGTTEGGLRYARDVFGLDFSAITNTLHAVTNEDWAKDRELFRAYQHDHGFVTIPAYENGFTVGHKNVYFLEEPENVRRAETPKELFSMLEGVTCMVISHHTNCSSETDPVRSWSCHDLSTIDPRFEPVVEICQNRGSFETDATGGEVHLGGGGSSIRDILARGLRVGFVGGTDTHRGRPGSRLSNQAGLDARELITGGLTAVRCGELTRESVWEAIRQRRCYATTGVRILLDFEVSGLEMGRDVRVTKGRRASLAERAVHVRAAGAGRIDRVVFVRNGAEAHTQRVDGAMTCDVTWRDDAPLEAVRDAKVRGAYYYAKVYLEDGNVAYASPVWLTYGKG